MVFVKQNSDNNPVSFTLRELQSEETPVFYFLFRHNATKAVVEYTGTDVSELKNRYNTFCIPGDIFPLKGDYTYFIFQDENKTKFLEKGILTVI